MKLHNTLTGTNDTFEPLHNDTVRIYTCGLTVYSQPHIGNWLGYIYWDILIRVLKAQGYNIERTQNITDVGHLVSDDDSGEDKMEKGARTEGITAWDVAKKYSEIAEHEAFEMLQLTRPDNLVAATSCIDAQVAFAKELDEKGYLYRTDDGMYFDTSMLTDYGKLARLDIEGLDAGARVAMAGKRNPTDFAVWKFSPSGAKRDMEWESPWGIGFPGWHLECSVIARETLGDEIDIHTGGIDHIPVHHTNEIAQTEAVTGKPFARFWLHNNHIKIDGHKISKSIGNIYTLDDISKRGFDIEAFKLMALSKHYRTEGNFTWEILESAQNRLRNWRAIAALRHQVHDTTIPDSQKYRHDRNKLVDEAKKQVQAALDNDLDTPAALAAIDTAFDRIERSPINDLGRQPLLELIDTIDELLGLSLAASTPDINDEHKQLIIERERSREEKNWAKSDELRDKLSENGISVRDTAAGTLWSYT